MIKTATLKEFLRNKGKHIEGWADNYRTTVKYFANVAGEFLNFQKKKKKGLVSFLGERHVNCFHAITPDAFWIGIYQGTYEAFTVCFLNHSYNCTTFWKL